VSGACPSPLMAQQRVPVRTKQLPSCKASDCTLTCDWWSTTACTRHDVGILEFCLRCCRVLAAAGTDLASMIKRACLHLNKLLASWRSACTAARYCY
jgi:hypothetical protein